MSEQTQLGYTRSYALVIGINSYTDARFVPLGEAEEDALRLADLLRSEPFNFQVRTLLGPQATREGILAALHDLRATTEQDRVLVYFAGHGYTLTDRYGAETGYLAAFDTEPDRDFTALELDGVTDLRRHAGAKHIAFIFDACFSGQALGLTRSPSVAAQAFLSRRAYQVISAGAGDQTVSDFNSMTDLIVGYLDPSALDASRLLTLSDLGLTLQRSMARDSRQMQIPQFGHLRGSQGGEFIFFAPEGVAPTPDAREPEPIFVEPEPVREMRSSRRRIPAWVLAAGSAIALAAVALLTVVVLALSSRGPDPGDPGSGGGKPTPTPTPTPSTERLPGGWSEPRWGGILLAEHNTKGITCAASDRIGSTGDIGSDRVHGVAVECEAAHL